jgi:hypothetical protein
MPQDFDQGQKHVGCDSDAFGRRIQSAAIAKVNSADADEEEDLTLLNGGE